MTPQTSPALPLGSLSRPLWLLSLCLLPACEDEPAKKTPPLFAAQAPQFEDVSQSRGFAPTRHFDEQTLAAAGALSPLLQVTGGLATGDVDADGDDDLLVLGGDSGAQLFIYGDDGEFEELASGFDLELDPLASGPLLADVDLDGFLDLVVTHLTTGRVSLLLNRDGERFVAAEAAFDTDEFAPAVGVAGADVDLDGDLDLFVARWAIGDTQDPHQGILWINKGNGEFEDRSDALPELERARSCDDSLWGVLSPTFADVFGTRDLELDDGQIVVDPNLDFYPELAIARYPGPNQLFLNMTTEADEPRFELFDVEREYYLSVDGSEPPAADGGYLDGSVQHTERQLIQANAEQIHSGALSSQLIDVDTNRYDDWLLLGAGTWADSCSLAESVAQRSTEREDTNAVSDAGMADGGGQPTGGAEAADAGALLDAGPHSVAADAGAPPPADLDASVLVTDNSALLDAAATARLPLTEGYAGNNPALVRGSEARTLDDGVSVSEHYIRWWSSYPFAPQGAPARNACVADFNNDGQVDVFLVTGQVETLDPPPRVPSADAGAGDAGIASADGGLLDAGDGGTPAVSHALLFIRERGEGFIETSVQAGIDDEGDGRWVSCFDVDADGDIDVFLMNADGGRFYENQLELTDGNANFFSLRIEGSESLPLPVGASVSTIWVTPREEVISRTQRVGLNSGAGQQGSTVLHFGFGDAFDFARLTVDWPDGAEPTVFDDLPVNETVRLRRTQAEGVE